MCYLPRCDPPSRTRCVRPGCNSRGFLAPMTTPSPLSRHPYPMDTPGGCVLHAGHAQASHPTLHRPTQQCPSPPFHGTIFHPCTVARGLVRHRSRMRESQEFPTFPATSRDAILTRVCQFCQIAGPIRGIPMSNPIGRIFYPIVVTAMVPKRLSKSGLKEGIRYEGRSPDPNDV